MTDHESLVRALGSPFCNGLLDAAHVLAKFEAVREIGILVEMEPGKAMRVKLKNGEWQMQIVDHPQHPTDEKGDGK
jgi:hypothetical protein